MMLLVVQKYQKIELDPIFERLFVYMCAFNNMREVHFIMRANKYWILQILTKIPRVSFRADLFLAINQEYARNHSVPRNIRSTRILHRKTVSVKPQSCRYMWVLVGAYFLSNNVSRIKRYIILLMLNFHILFLCFYFFFPSSEPSNRRFRNNA